MTKEQYREAKAFAYELVMPLNLFMRAYKKRNGDIFLLAEDFLVTETRVSKRIEFLKKQIQNGDVYDFMGDDVCKKIPFQ